MGPDSSGVRAPAGPDFALGRAGGPLTAAAALEALRRDLGGGWTVEDLSGPAR
ncbi:hypothetical protein [Kitasatospora sp. NPDC054795]